MVAGVLLLAFGACALNQFQERRLDALMPRTRNRPLPGGRMAPSTALALAFSFALSGFWVLLLGVGITPALLGLAALAWYNGAYTPLKRVTAFAVIPGALVGAIPPVLGWTAGGGELISPQSLALAFFFFIWQVPHFWILLASHGPEYESAGLPALTRALSPQSVTRLTFVWTCTAGASALLLPVFGVATAAATKILILAASGALCAAAFPTLATRDPAANRRAFHAINLFALVLCTLLVADAWLRPRL